MEAAYQIAQSSPKRELAKTRSFAEFFAGIGLMRLGLENAGWQVAFANDISEDKHEMYAANFPDTGDHFLLGDVHALDSQNIPSVMLATASFPCTDLSVAGMRHGLGGRNSSAYWGFIRVLKELGKRRPPLVLLENVVGFLSSHNGMDFYAALSALNDLGYVVDAFIVDAVNFVPQSRVRLFVVGRQSDEGVQFRDPQIFYESPTRPHALAEFIFGHPDIMWDLRNIPNPPKCSLRLSDVLEEIDSDSTLWWNRHRVEYLINQMSVKHGNMLRDMASKKKWSYATVFRRVRNGKSMAELRNDGIAGCLRTPRGGSARQILIKVGYGQVHVRLLTPIECARLMGADNFNITTSLNKALFGFGDAVCVPVVTWLAQVYLNPIVDEMLQNVKSQNEGSVYGRK